MPQRLYLKNRPGEGWKRMSDKQETFRVIGVRADGGKVMIVRFALRDAAEKIVTLLSPERNFERFEIVPEDRDPQA